MMYVSEIKGATTWADFDTKQPGNMSIGEAFMMQIFDTIIYALLAYYLDQVMPSDYMTRRHPLFFTKTAFWTNSGLLLFWKNRKPEPEPDMQQSTPLQYDVLIELNGNPDFELMGMDSVSTMGIVTSKLCKNFSSISSLLTSFNKSTNPAHPVRSAVDNLSMAIYKNEITAILGHNGAGKTTTIRMLTGQTAPTSGAAHILGYNIHTDSGLRALQATLGLATQDNILWPSLTITEHLYIFGMLKGLTARQVRSSGRHLLHQLDLTEKSNTRTEKLSGGQKRRLCLALALVGDPKIVFLDEPSCGVDPQSRRRMWDVLNAYKANDRCIVLTTHSMYEADVLADRKLIISKGKLRCAGSSVFLKNRFGVGYKLNIEFDTTSGNIADREASVNLLKQKIGALVPSATFPKMYGAYFEQLHVQLPKNEMDKYADLFKLLESSEVEHMGITDIGVSMVSLEEVFLKISEDDNGNVPKPVGVEEFEYRRLSLEAGLQAPAPYWKKFVALVRIRLVLWRRRPTRYLVSLIVSILLLVPPTYFETMLENLIHRTRDADNKASHTPVDIGAWQKSLLTSDSFPVVIRTPNDDMYTSATHATDSSGVKYRRMSAATTTYANLSDSTSNLTTPKTASYYLAGADIQQWPPTASDATANAAQYTVWYNATFTHAAPMALNFINSLFYNTMTRRTSGIALKIYQISNEGFGPEPPPPPTKPPNPYGYPEYTLSYEPTTTPTPVDVVGETLATPVMLSIAVVPAFLTIALTFSTSFLIVDAVYDRQTGAIRLLRLSGAHGALYWVSLFVVHFATYILPFGIAFIIFCSIWPNTFMLHSRTACFLFFLHNSFFVLLLTLSGYCASMLWRRVSSALAANMIGSIALGFAMAICAVSVVSVIIQKMFETEAAAKYRHGPPKPEYTMFEKSTHQVMSILVPYWAYPGGVAALIGADVLLRTPNSLFTVAIVGLTVWLCIALCTLTLAELITTGAAQSMLARYVFAGVVDEQIRTHLDLDVHHAGLFEYQQAHDREDDDVQAERMAASRTASALAERHAGSRASVDAEKRQRTTLLPPPSAAITALHLQKRYGGGSKEFFARFKHDIDLFERYSSAGTAAVRNVSFRVQPNEIFGLLGPNGAGKTTVMAMLVNETMPTAGLIYIDKYNSLSQRSDATKLLGYCPQFDALWDEATVEEHLNLIAALHGQQANMASPNGLIWELAERLGLTEHNWHKQACRLSGGTRRKLSFLISIIDRNMTSLLDEPSSGMDPSSARHLWDIIRNHFKNRTATSHVDTSVGGMLTTHHMEEAEALCDRIAIMTRGYIRCIGTPTHLRNKFGLGYRLELRLTDADDGTRDYVTKIVMGQFSEAILKSDESRLNRLVFVVPQHQALPLSRSFAFLESQRKQQTAMTAAAETVEAARLSNGSATVKRNSLTSISPQVNAVPKKCIMEYTITQASIEHVFLRFAAAK